MHGGTEARQRVWSAKQCSKLTLGQNKHGQNITAPAKCQNIIHTASAIITDIAIMLQHNLSNNIFSVYLRAA